MAVKITAIPWGCSIFGEAVTLRRVESDALSFEVLDYGATLRSLRVKDTHGAWVDVVLGYDSLAEYEQNDGYLGAVVGRVATGSQVRNSSWMGTAIRSIKTTASTTCTVASVALTSMSGPWKNCRTDFA